MDLESQSNGAMMRISPLGIWCVRHMNENDGFQTIARLAAEDAKITHPNKVCIDANILYVNAIAEAIKNPQTPQMLYDKIADWTERPDADPTLRETVEAARFSPPNYTKNKGLVLIAFQNALYQLLHAPSFEEALVDTVMRGGDTDTNAAICGALLGAVYGLEAIPEQWREAVLNCKPSADNPKTRHPRPEYYWPTDALTLAEQLLGNLGAH
jgi:ADP-ribosylglycohydrolase